MLNNIKTILVTLALLSVVSYASASLATEVVCPVCGKSFDESVETCPNDGTDLKSLGIVIASDEDEDTDEDTEEVDDDGASGYQRGDVRDRRRIVPGKDDEADYSDRASRIIGDDRNDAGPTAAQKRKRRQAFREKDGELRDQYETIRAREDEHRRRVVVEEVIAQKNKEKAAAMLLGGMAGPLTSLGYRGFWMGQGGEPGPVSAAEIDLNITRYKLRIGLSSLIGARSTDSSRDLVFLEHLSVGVQRPSRFSPFVMARGGIGVIAYGDTYNNDKEAEFLTAFGVETGMDSWVTPWIAITPSVGFMRSMTYGSGWNSFTFKVSVGF